MVFYHSIDDRHVFGIDRKNFLTGFGSECGYYYKDLGDKKEWTCPNCQTHHDKDINAAKNIQNEGLNLLIDNPLVNLRNWGDSTVILLSLESTSP